MALAKALELSRLEEQSKQPASATRHGPYPTRQPGHGDLVGVTITEAVKKRISIHFGHVPTGLPPASWDF